VQFRKGSREIGERRRADARHPGRTPHAHARI